MANEGSIETGDGHPAVNEKDGPDTGINPAVNEGVEEVEEVAPTMSSEDSAEKEKTQKHEEKEVEGLDNGGSQVAEPTTGDMETTGSDGSPAVNEGPAESSPALNNNKKVNGQNSTIDAPVVKPRLTQGGRQRGRGRGNAELGGVIESIGRDKPKENSSEACKKVNCGEGGCFMNHSMPVCVCIETWTPPDEYGRCTHIIDSPINPIFNVPEPPGHHFPDHNATIGLTPYNKNETSSMPLLSKLNMDNIHLQVIKIALPLFGSLTLILLIALLLWRRRRVIYNRPPISESPITWLHRQDSLILLDQLTVVSKNPNYYTPDLEAPSLANLRTKLIPREHLKLLEEIGEGAFGKVFKGEVAWSKESISLVAVKVLKEGASRETREDFKREVEIMSAFDHENILKLIGVVAIEEDSPYMIFEYMEYGDLADLLRKNDPIHGREKTLDLKQTDLIDIATQIANGMMYLTSQHFVHRDLATRNCLVGGELVVKISDFGMSRDIYTCDYYRIGGSRMLPVRWMSPESVKYGRFTSESDVWAYGVVLWEIFSYGKQPYYGHTNEEVIRFIEDGILLQKPDGCPSTIYHVMLGCWRSVPKDRFNFERIHRHLVEFGRKMVKCYHQLQNNDDGEYEDI